MLGINSIIGAGIFLTPGSVIKLAGTWAPLAYVLAGIFAAVLALVFATAARYVKTNGASYAYTTAAFGQRIGIYVGVTHAIAASIAWGALTSFFVSTFLEVVFPGQPWAEDSTVFGARTWTFLIFMTVLLIINLTGNKAIKWANGLSTIAKLTALSAFVVGGTWIIATQHINNYRSADHVYQPRTYSLFGAFDMGHSTAGALLMATIAALYVYTGFESIANAAEEMKDPDRNLPRAIPIALLAVAIIYTLTIVIGMLLGADKIATSSDTVRLTAAIGNDVFRGAILVGALISMFGINVAGSFGAPRLWTALSNEGILPRGLSARNRFGVPTRAFALTATLAVAFPLALQFDDSDLTGLAVIARFVQFLVVPVALLALARSNAPQWAAVRRGVLTDRILPIAALLITVLLAVSFDYRTIVLEKTGHPNTFSIVLLVVSFVLVPALAYGYYYRSLRKSGAQ